MQRYVVPTHIPQQNLQQMSNSIFNSEQVCTSRAVDTPIPLLNDCVHLNLDLKWLDCAIPTKHVADPRSQMPTLELPINKEHNLGCTPIQTSDPRVENYQSSLLRITHTKDAIDGVAWQQFSSGTLLARTCLPEWSTGNCLAVRQLQRPHDAQQLRVSLTSLLHSRVATKMHNHLMPGSQAIAVHTCACMQGICCSHN
jgi:hypothetical protein